MKSSISIIKVPFKSYREEKELTLTLNRQEMLILKAIIGDASASRIHDLVTKNMGYFPNTFKDSEMEKLSASDLARINSAIYHILADSVE